jgi:hypothetical protein
MPKTSNKARSAGEIAEMATRGEDISAHFSNKFMVVRPVRRDERAARRSISRQAVIKTLPGRAPNEEYRPRPKDS